MIVVLKTGAPREGVTELTKYLEHFHVNVSPIEGTGTTILGLVGDTSSINPENILMYDVVERVMKVQEPYKRANRRFHPHDTQITLPGTDIVIGGKKIVVMAGPCSVESHEQIDTVAGAVHASGAEILRGGTYKPRSSPYSFQGLKDEGVAMLHAARDKYHMPIISEITGADHLPIYERDVDIIQVGARNMQNFELLRALGRSKKPILLKRGFANSIEELLMAAEYIMSEGNEQVMLCERGIRTFETATRNTLDISAVPVLKMHSHLPVIVDPSHAAGAYQLVPALAKAAVAAGADGLIIEVHPNPREALSDGAQSLTPHAFDKLMGELRPIAHAVGREL